MSKALWLIITIVGPSVLNNKMTCYMFIMHINHISQLTFLDVTAHKPHTIYMEIYLLLFHFIVTHFTADTLCLLV